MQAHVPSRQLDGGSEFISKYFDAFPRFLGVVVGQLLFQVHLWIAVRQVQLLCVHFLSLAVVQNHLTQARDKSGQSNGDGFS